MIREKLDRTRRIAKCDVKRLDMVSLPGGPAIQALVAMRQGFKTIDISCGKQFSITTGHLADVRTDVKNGADGQLRHAVEPAP